jgi:signal transduction histidine kinase
MSETDLARLRHDLANPLAALLAEVQLLLVDPHALPAELVTALREIERQALRMRVLLRA